MAADRPLGYRTQTSVTSGALGRRLRRDRGPRTTSMVGRRAGDDKFKLLSIDALDARRRSASFSSSGAAWRTAPSTMGSTVTVSDAPRVLYRDRRAPGPYAREAMGRALRPPLRHRARGRRIGGHYGADRARELRPVLAAPVIRSVFRVYVNRADREAAHERSPSWPRSASPADVQNESVQFSQTKRFSRKFRLCPPQRWHRRYVPPQAHAIGSVVAPGRSQVVAGSEGRGFGSRAASSARRRKGTRAGSGRAPDHEAPVHRDRRNREQRLAGALQHDDPLLRVRVRVWANAG